MFTPIPMKFILVLFCLLELFTSKTSAQKAAEKTINKSKDGETTITISRDKYRDQLHGFWLGQCIANWTGLVTEMDKIGNIGEIKTGDFILAQIGDNLINLASGGKVFPAHFLRP